MKRLQRHKGFTLLEIMVALVIFAIMAVIVAVGMRTILDSRKHVQIADQQVQQMEIAFALMQRDFSQIIDRPVLDKEGDSEQSLLAAGSGEVAFTRAGFVNPLFSQPRSELMRVAYSVQDGALIRTTWNVLDQPPNGKAMHRTLLQGVLSMNLQYIDFYGQVVNSWVLQSGAGGQQDPHQVMPKGIIVTLHLPHNLKIKRIFVIGGVGLNDP